MKIQNVLKTILLEDSRFEKQYQQFVLPSEKHPKGIMPFEQYKTFVFADPETKKPENFDEDGASVEDMKNVTIGPHVQWLIKHFLKPSDEELKKIDDSLTIDDFKNKTDKAKNAVKRFRHFYIEDLFKLTDILSKFKDIKQYLPVEKRDVLKLKPDELFDLYTELPDEVKEKLDKLSVKTQARKERKDDRFAHPGGKIIFRGPNYTVVKIESTGADGQEAASYYGGYYDWSNGESKWCTSPPNSSHFRSHIVQGPLYVILANDDKGKVGKRTGLPTERYQFHFGNYTQMKDVMDYEISLDLLTDGPLSEVKEVFKDEILKDYYRRNEGASKMKLELGSSSSPGGLFVTLYGIDELINKMPKEIKTLYIGNTSNRNFAIDFPPTLGNLTNIRSLGLSNCVKSLPDTICNMKDLDFLILDKNKEMETIPACLANLDGLSVINLRGSNPNLVIPTEIAKEFHNDDNGFYTRNI